MDLESRHTEKKTSFDRVTVGLAVEQSNIEKECDLAQVQLIYLYFMKIVMCIFTMDEPRGTLRGCSECYDRK